MIIQSKKVWIADQFISAAVELEQGKITGIFPYGEKQALSLIHISEPTRHVP